MTMNSLGDGHQFLFYKSSVSINTVIEHEKCGSFWDSRNARFDECFFPFLSIIPTVIVALIALAYFLRRFHQLRPQWAQPFIAEFSEPKGGLPKDAKKDFFNFGLISLLLSTLVGFVAWIVIIVRWDHQFSSILSAVSWGVLFILAAVTVPRTAPASFIAFYVTELALLIPGLVEAGTRLNDRQIVECLVVVAAFVAIVNVLLMPLRDPRLPLDDICPVHHTPTSSFRSPEDNLTLWQFVTVSWMAPMISIGSRRQMHDDDVWFLAYVFQHKRLHESFRQLQGSVTRRLLSANGIDIVIITVLGILQSLAAYSTPLLLQKLLWSMETPNVPRSSAITYSLLSLLLRFIAAQSDVINLWYSRRCYERSRGEMITMLYEKTLLRKIAGDQSGTHSDETDNSGSDNTKSSSTHSWRNCGKIKMRMGLKGKSAKKKRSKPASMGKILNLMRGDVYEVAQRFWEIETIVTTPLGLVLSIAFTWKLIGWPCLLGILTVVIAQSANAIITRLLISYERLRRSTTDDRLQATSQFVEAIRHLRWYGWQDQWLEQIIAARQRELKWRVVSALWNAVIYSFTFFSTGMFPVAVLYAYTVLAGRPLSISLIFPALQLFQMLESTLREVPGLITTLINAYIAMGRIEDFMKEPNKDHAELYLNTLEDPKLGLENASFAWPGMIEPVLNNLNLSFPPGLNVVCGKVGAGKSALLQALLGELDIMHGIYEPPGEMIGYCAQTPWLQSMSIRENILFSSPYDEQRYKLVLEACALIPDLANFKHGDLSNIGENGIGLSGGQKARVALARAMYSKSRILLLDDPISALDHQTAEIVVRRCLTGPLSEGRTIVLVTHRTELCTGIAEQIIEISGGRAQVLSTSLPSSVSNSSGSNDSLKADQDRACEDQNTAAIPDKFIEDEHRAHGGVQVRVYWEYIKAGKIKWWILLICLLTISRLMSLLKQWFLKAWGEAYDHPIETISSGLFDSLPQPEMNVQPWLLMLFILAVAQTISAFVGQAFMLVIVYSAGKQMFQEALNKVSHATFRFYDITPVGRLMNRLTSDIGTVDGNISFQFQMIAFGVVQWISSLAVFASVTPVFLVFSIALTAAFVLIFRRFLPTSQSLRRLEMVSLSPLMSNFGALVEGLVTVRAFCAQHRFQDRVIQVVDNFQKMDHFYWTLQAWLMYRFDTLSAFSSFVLTILALFTNVSPGLTAFVLIAADNFVQATHMLCRQYGSLQMEFVSVERVVELLKLEQEPKGDIEPPAWWPSFLVDVEFQNVTIRYAPHLDTSLHNVSLRIPGSSTTAIVGRTGSGKSTLALSLLATVRPEQGQILLDNIDIARVNTQALRTRVTFLAQDPVLFPGSMRKNLDPMNEHSDEDCAGVLERVCSRHGWRLDTEIEAGGRNLSQGQRQLIGLTRTVLRRSPVVILDEATASVDLETSTEIQQILRDEMKESTVITIAHRIEAVKNADYCIVLDKGGVLAQGSAIEMLRNGAAVNNMPSADED